MIQILEDIDEGVAECRDLFDHFNTKVDLSNTPVVWSCIHCTNTLTLYLSHTLSHSLILTISLSLTSLFKVANKQADVLYVLTFVTILLAPLQILTGLYGMNFDYIPELHWENGYAYFWSLALSLIAALATSFYRMGWLRLPKADKED